jgi:hypothetical protein
VDDVRQIRELIVDRDYWKARAAEAERQSAGWQKSSANWQSLYEAEKSRADGVQEKRIAELLASNAELGKANAVYKLQAADDRQKIGEQEFTIRKLKRERKYYFAAGFATGFTAGGYTGYRIGARFRF